jgi:DNA polymerase I-like protein with 3'-5' exonuclease and polymerase domains
MKLITIDFETYYDREFSLSKLTTEEYVRSPLFEMIGVATQINNEKPLWFPKHEVAAHLASIDWSDAMVVAQNTAFDGAIMSWLYDITPMAWADTLGMSRALYPHERSHSLAKQAERFRIGVKGNEVLNALGKHYDDFSAEELARYGSYCCNDVTLTYGLFNIYMEMGFPKTELKLIDLTLRMFTEPALVLDKEHLIDHHGDVLARKELLLDSVRRILSADEGEDVKKLLMSNPKFAILLENYGVEPPMKTSLTTGKQAYAFAKTDEEFQALAEHEDDRVQALVAARLGTKSTIEETRTKRFIDMADRGPFPVPLRYYGAHSGRWSGQDKINLQNLPSRGANAKKIKQSIRAPEGYVVIDCDSAQIEARTLAWLAGQTNLIEAFANKEDVYKIMAEAIYNIPRENINKQQRQVGKVVILGAGYGVGHHKLQLFLKMQAGVEVELHEAKFMIDTYRASNFRIKELWYKADEALEALRVGQTFQVDVPGIINAVPGSGLTLPSGLFIQYPGLSKSFDEEKGRDQWTYMSKGIKTYIYGGKIVENFTQAVARCVVAEQMLRIAKRYKVALTVHDSVVTLAKREEQEEAVAYIEECMSWQPRWAKGLPLACESEVGDSYGG